MDETLTALRALMLECAPGMVVAKDGEGGLMLNAPWPNPVHPEQAMFFGAVRPGKAYVGYHLMPVYSHPALLSSLSPALKRRMQGKSCFNFKKTDPVLFEELAELTRLCAKTYESPFVLEPRRP